MKHFALLVRTVAAWLVTLLLVFPLIWLVLTAFKTELQAIAVPPQLFFTPTLESFREVQHAQRLPAITPRTRSSRASSRRCSAWRSPRRPPTRWRSSAPGARATS